MQSFNLPKYVVAALLMMERLFSVLVYCESGINQYTRQKTLTMFLGRICYYLNSVALETLYCHTN